jgi:hypothetical protein
VKVTWKLASSDPVVTPEWVLQQERDIAACSEHAWVLKLYHPEDDCYAELTCEKCPAGMDDLYPDGHYLMYLELGDVTIEEGRHNSPVPLTVPVTARVESWYTSTPINGEEWHVELVIEPRGEITYGEA